MQPTGDKGPQELGNAAEQLVREAIGRGRKRRAGRPNVSHDEIRLNQKPRQIVDASKQIPYQKRRRASLIPGDEEEDDSNDEWEEHVELDRDMLEAGVKVAEMEKDAREKEEEHESKGAKSGADVEKTTPDEPSKEAKARQKLVRALKQKKALTRHTVHLLMLISHVMRVDAGANDDETRAFAISIAPMDTFLEDGNFVERLSRLALWLKVQFRYTAFVHCGEGVSRVDEKLEFEPCLKKRALEVIQNGKGDIIDVAAVAAAILRAQGFRCRVVSPLQPLLHHVRKKIMKTRTSDNARYRVPQQLFDSVMYAWIEVWSPDHLQWIPVDLFDGSLHLSFRKDAFRRSIERIPVVASEPTDVEAEVEQSSKRRKLRNRKIQKLPNNTATRVLRKTGPALFAHVIAVESGVVVDVSRRYNQKWFQVDKGRAKGEVFSKAIENASPKLPDPLTDEARKHELEEFKKLDAAEGIPNTITGVQRHPHYILERHLRKYEILYPKHAVLGHIHGEPIYHRENVKLLHTKDRWVRKMRMVKPQEASLKSVRAMNGSDIPVELFGKWQTVPLVIAACVDGRVPRGFHGNVDLWTPEHLPGGTTHVNMPYAKVAARKLGIDFASAMTGFEIRCGRSIPRIEGVVVACENEEVVRDGARAAAEAAAARREEKAKEEALLRWLKLLRTIKSREKVRKLYGNLSGFGETYEKEQKLRGAKKAMMEKKRDGMELEDGNENSGSQTGGMQRALTDAHEHEFGEPRTAEGNMQVKSCKLCKLDVCFETL